eukprot:TRINITY_DN54693_c0_g1_i13.p2 TRINITY_DN54693_c0_g1~~TRINITY_DN54693_c0_g1_i13.p2  ORF type:complete len:183 (-),score=18.91 TRINITY_DN54693_c0_g1_i13:1-549(-)
MEAHDVADLCLEPPILANSLVAAAVVGALLHVRLQGDYPCGAIHAHRSAVETSGRARPEAHRARNQDAIADVLAECFDAAVRITGGCRARGPCGEQSGGGGRVRHDGGDGAEHGRTHPADNAGTQQSPSSNSHEIRSFQRTDRARPRDARFDARIKSEIAKAGLTNGPILFAIFHLFLAIQQ